MCCAEQPARCNVSPSEAFIPHKHTWQQVINIVSCSGSSHGCAHQLLSPERQTRGRNSRGKAAWLTILLITTRLPLHVRAQLFGDQGCSDKRGSRESGLNMLFVKLT